MQLTETELSVVVDSLKKLEPGFLPYPLFLEMARLVALSIIEVVPVRKGRDDRIEVFLTQRDPHDSFWPNMWHNPGTVVRATDEDSDYVDAARRIFWDELDVAYVPELHFVTSFLHKTRRGTESTRVYWAELLDTPKTGTFFDVESLPATTIGSHVGLIRAAAKAYEASVASAWIHRRIPRNSYKNNMKDAL
jgi:hypothetical protein